jgi:propanediol dehydratase small subunit
LVTGVSFRNHQQWRIGAMKKAVLAAVISGAIAAGASIYAASGWSGDKPISGNGPVTEQQIRDWLTADGFSQIQITLQGGIFETVAIKDGRSTEFAIKAQTGAVRSAPDDDDDGD